MKANWFVTALLTCATSIAGAKPPTPAASSCVPQGQLVLRVQRGKATGIQLKTTSSRSTFETSFQPLPKQLRTQLLRGLPMQMELSAEVLDVHGQVLDRLDHTCRVNWLVWQEVYSIEMWTSGQHRERTTLTADGVMRACLGVAGYLRANLAKVNAARLRVRLDVNRNPVTSPTGWVRRFLYKAMPAAGALGYSDVADTGMLTVCPASASSSSTSSGKANTSSSSSSGTP